METNKELIKYCKDNDFPINDMNAEDFKKVEKSLGYSCYLFHKSMNELFNPILKLIINIFNKFKSN